MGIVESSQLRNSEHFLFNAPGGEGQPPGDVYSNSRKKRPLKAIFAV